MDNLPNELIFEIFKNLDLYDLIINCKLISTKFYKLINQFKFKELIMKNNNLRNNYWYLKYESIDLKNTLFNYKFNFLEFKSFKENFRNLERLKLEINRSFNLTSLNQLKNLKTIEIENTNLLNEDICLELPKLELMKIDLSFVNQFQLTIKSSKLKSIRCYSFKGIRLIDETALTYLHCEKLDYDLRSFTNLKILKFEDIDYLPNDLIDLIPINLEAIYVYYPFNYRPLFNIKLSSIIFNSSKFEHFKSIKFYLQDIEFKFQSNIQFNNQNQNLDFIFDNYDQLVSNSTYNHFDYVNLLKKFNYKLPVDFFDKFKLIQSLTISKYYLIDVESQLINFLKRCSNLHSIYLKNNCFTQQFYEELAKSCRLIEKFYLIDVNELNFEFLLQFKLLNSLKLNYKLSIYLIYQIFKLNFMEEFKMDNNLITISKKKGDNKFKKDDWTDLELEKLINSLIINSKDKFLFFF